MTHHCLPTIISDILCFNIHELLHILCLPQRGCWRHCLYFSLYLPNYQHPYVLFFHSYYTLSVEAAFSGIVVVSVVIYFIAFSLSILFSVAIFSTLVTFPLRNLVFFFLISFLWHSTLEPSLMIQTFPVFFFRLMLSSRMNVYLHSNLWNPNI